MTEQKIWLWTGRLAQVITVYKAINLSLPILLPLILNHWGVVAICGAIIISFFVGRYSMDRQLNHGHWK